MMKFVFACALCAVVCRAATTNTVGYSVLVNDAGDTRPANTIATSAQVASATNAALSARVAATNAAALAQAAQASASAANALLAPYGTNYVVTSTVYVQSIGGVPYDPSNQTINVQSISRSGTNLQIVATVRQAPLSLPRLDWRVSLTAGTWTNIASTVAETSIPAGVTNAAKAYLFSLAVSTNTSFFRVVDNSSGASGSGLYWLVYGGIHVDGRAGRSGALTNVVGGVTNTYQIRGGIVVEPTPL